MTPVLTFLASAPMILAYPTSLSSTI